MMNIHIEIRWKRNHHQFSTADDVVRMHSCMLLLNFELWCGADAYDSYGVGAGTGIHSGSATTGTNPPYNNTSGTGYGTGDGLTSTGGTGYGTGRQGVVGKVEDAVTGVPGHGTGTGYNTTGPGYGTGNQGVVGRVEDDVTGVPGHRAGYGPMTGTGTGTGVGTGTGYGADSYGAGTGYGGGNTGLGATGQGSRYGVVDNEYGMGGVNTGTTGTGGGLISKVKAKMTGHT